MTKTRSRLFVLLAAAGALGCSSPSEAPERFPVPSSMRFDAVARTLDAHCGTLDCHGSSRRNLVLFGHSGLRLSADDRPGSAATTPLEAGMDYCAVTSLEPEVMARVVADDGERPERLTLVRKARGSERHTGGSVFPAGSSGDRCLVEWLRGYDTEDGGVAAMVAACEASLEHFETAPPRTEGIVDLSACSRAVVEGP